MPRAPASACSSRNRRVHERGVPLIVVVNRLPADASDRELVMTDTARLFAEHGLRDTSETPVIAIPEGALDPDVQGVSRPAISALRERVAQLASTATDRRELATQALAGAIRGLAPLV